MPNIAILHPQCVRLGGAIQMALQSAHALQNLGHDVILYTFEKNDTCFPGLQLGLNIQVWGDQKNNSTKTPFLKGERKSEENKGDLGNNKSSVLDKLGQLLQKGAKNPLAKLTRMITLAWHLRHVDTIVANNPPMQTVAALAKAFSLSKVRTIWWHHHVPWYYNKKGIIIFLKKCFEKYCIIPWIDEMIATSHYVADCIKEYCGRGSTVVHPILEGGMIHSAGEVKNNTSNQITLFTHGRLEPGKGIDMVVRVFEHLKKEYPDIHLIVFGTGSLEEKLREQGIDVRPFDRDSTFTELHSDKNGHVIGVYCSSIDAFGIAPLETQSAGFSTIVLDRGGARESILTNMSGDCVGYLVQDEEELFRILSHYVKEKSFPKPVSNVNFSHTRDYFTLGRLTRDLSFLITKAHT